MQPKTISPFIAEHAAPAIGPYSHGVVCTGRMVFLSGQIALSSEGAMIGTTVAEQSTQVFHNIRTILKTQGATLDNVVKATVFLADMNSFAEMNACYSDAFGHHKPARSAVEVSRLPKDALVEIEVVACID